MKKIISSLMVVGVLVGANASDKLPEFNYGSAGIANTLNEVLFPNFGIIQVGYENYRGLDEKAPFLSGKLFSEIKIDGLTPNIGLLGGVSGKLSKYQKDILIETIGGKDIFFISSGVGFLQQDAKSMETVTVKDSFGINDITTTQNVTTSQSAPYYSIGGGVAVPFLNESTLSIDAKYLLSLDRADLDYGYRFGVGLVDGNFGVKLGYEHLAFNGAEAAKNASVLVSYSRSF